MSLVDFEVFLRERLASYDENLDLSPGAPLDTRVIQPILRRIGQTLSAPMRQPSSSSDWPRSFLT